MRKRLFGSADRFGVVARAAARRPADLGRMYHPGSRRLSRQMAFGHHRHRALVRPPFVPVCAAPLLPASTWPRTDLMTHPARPSRPSRAATVGRRLTPTEGGPIRHFVNRSEVHSRASFRQRPRSTRDRSRPGPGALRTTPRNDPRNGPDFFEPGAALRRLSLCQGSSLPTQPASPADRSNLIYDSNAPSVKRERK